MLTECLYLLLFLFFLFLCCVMDEGLIVHVLVGDIRDPHTNVRDVCFCSILTVLLCVNPQGKDVQLSEWVTEENSNLVVLPLMMMMMVVTFLEVIVITFFPVPLSVPLQFGCSGRVTGQGDPLVVAGYIWAEGSL